MSGERRITYAELDGLVEAAADGLYGLGVRRGGTVGLLCTNRWEWICAALGAMRIGARLAAFNTFARAWDLEYMLSHSDTEVLVIIDRFRSRDYLETVRELGVEIDRTGWKVDAFPRLREVVLVGDGPVPDGARHFDALLEAASPRPAGEAVTSAGDDAYVLYTSGSSARPKAVPLQHYAAVENAFNIGERMELTPEDRVWVAVPLFWAYGAVNALPAALTHGSALVLQEAFDAAEAIDLIERHACTAAYTLPNMTNALIAQPSFSTERTATLRTGLTIGSESDVRRAAVDLGIPAICNIYGGTETYGNCCVSPASWPLERRLESQGPPLPGVELRIVGPEGEDLPQGEVGEILVRGYVMQGYVAAEGSAAADTPFVDGWYRTGDLGSLGEDGRLRFSARATDMIKTGGINVAPREVEEFLELHPDISEVAVVGVPDEQAGEVPVAYVTGRSGSSLDGEELRAYCLERIARYKVPARFHVVDDLPKLDTGKLARRAMVEMDRQAVGGRT